MEIKEHSAVEAEEEKHKEIWSRSQKPGDVSKARQRAGLSLVTDRGWHGQTSAFSKI